MNLIRPDNISLPNLSWKEKVLFSTLLLSGIGLFAFSWFYVLITVYWPGMADSGIDSLGVALGVLAGEDEGAYFRVFGLHVLSTLMLILPAGLLYRKMSIRRRMKAVIATSAFILLLLDVSAWYKAPTCSPTNPFVGIVGFASAFPLLSLAIIPLWEMWVFKRWRSSSPTRIAIIGGGFAGLYTALGLNRKLGYHKNLELTLIDRKNYFLFPPLLPSAAAGSIETRQVSYPFRRIFETTNIIFRKVDVSRVDPVTNKVYGIVETNQDVATGAPVRREVEFQYDYLIVAPGSTTQTFNTKGAERYGFMMRELGDAIRLRNHVIDCFERAAVLESRKEREELLTFVIVGGGPTGIETATEIHDLIRHILLKRYPEIDPEVPSVCILQSGKQVLPGWPDDIVRMTEKQLKKMNLRVVFDSRVTEVGPRQVMLKNGDCIKCRTAIWAAGVKPPQFLTRCGFPLHRSGRIEVEKDLRVKNFKTVFAIGDSAYLLDEKSQQPLPPLGQVAFQQGSHTAKNIVRILTGKETKPFRYFDFGGLVSVGEHFAAVNLLGVRISGFVGWVIWRSLYLAKLVGVSNRIRVLIDWTLDLLIERSISQIRDESIVPVEPSNIEVKPATITAAVAIT